MNSLSHGFIFVCGLSWLLCEVCVSAGAGYWTPLWFYLAGFIIMFSLMGCLPISERAINLAGPIFTLIIGGGILLYAFGGYRAAMAIGEAGSLKSAAMSVGAHLRLLGGGAMIGLAVVSLLSREKAPAHAH